MHLHSDDNTQPESILWHNYEGIQESAGPLKWPDDRMTTQHTMIFWPHWNKQMPAQQCKV